MVRYLYSNDAILKVLTPWNYIEEGQNKWVECEVVKTFHPIYAVNSTLIVNALNWKVH